MINEPASILTRRAARDFVRAHYLIRIEAKDRQSGEMVAMGLWNGPDNRNFNAGGTGNLDYFAAGRILELPDFQTEIGLDARTYEIGLSQTDDYVQLAVRGYDIRFSPVKIFRTEWDRYGKIIATPRLIFDGFIDGSPVATPEFLGETGRVSLRIVSDAKLLTRYGSYMKNHEFHKRRGNDQFRKYSSIQVADLPWGRKVKKEKTDFVNPRFGI